MGRGSKILRSAQIAGKDKGLAGKNGIAIIYFFEENSGTQEIVLRTSEIELEKGLQEDKLQILSMLYRSGRY